MNRHWRKIVSADDVPGLLVHPNEKRPLPKFHTRFEFKFLGEMHIVYGILPCIEKIASPQLAQTCRWIEAQGNYVLLNLDNNITQLLREKMDALEKKLDPQKFVRIHRSVIVNVDQVREIFREGQSEGSVALSTGQRLKMSKAGWQALLSISQR